jgi:predicted nucleic acid-binding protein
VAAAYVDSSAIVKLAVREPESRVLRRYLHRRRPVLSSALAQTEVLRALIAAGEPALAAGRRALAGFDLVRVNDRILRRAGTLHPAELRSLDAIHLATATELMADVREIVTYDVRMADAARGMGFKVSSPS